MHSSAPHRGCGARTSRTQESTPLPWGEKGGCAEISGNRIEQKLNGRGLGTLPLADHIRGCWSGPEEQAKDDRGGDHFLHFPTARQKIYTIEEAAKVPGLNGFLAYTEDQSKLSDRKSAVTAFVWVCVNKVCPMGWKCQTLWKRQDGDSLLFPFQTSPQSSGITYMSIQVETRLTQQNTIRGHLHKPKHKPKTQSVPIESTRPMEGHSHFIIARQNPLKQILRLPERKQ